MAVNHCERQIRRLGRVVELEIKEKCITILV
jgi:hypothetical protein